MEHIAENNVKQLIKTSGKISDPKYIESLTKLFTGMQNQNAEQNTAQLSNKLNKNFMGTHIVLPNTTNDKVNKAVYSINNNLAPKLSIGEIFIEDETNIKKISLEVGGSSFEKLDECNMNLFSVLKNLYNMKGIPFCILKKGIPNITYHEIRINIEFYNEVNLNDVPLTVELFSNKANIGNHNMAGGGDLNNSSFFSYYTGYCREINITDKMKLNFNHPTIALVVKTSDDSKPKYLMLNTFKIYLDKHMSKFGYNIYKFKPHKLAPSFTSQSAIDKTLKSCINFSRVDNAVLHFPNNNPKTVHIYQIYLNGQRFMAGMGGLMYCS